MKNIPTLDRVEDLLPLSLEIARFKIWAARRKSGAPRRGSSGSVDDLPLAGHGADPFEQAARRERMERLESALWRHWASGAASCFA